MNYTREEIMNMDGQALNRAVAEQVMGYTIYHYDKDYEENCYFMLMNDEFDPVEPLDGRRKTEEEAWNDCPDFSGSISAAWEVVEKIGETWEVKVFNRNGWTCYISSSLDEGYNYRETGDTAPLAICRTALLATMEETP